MDACAYLNVGFTGCNAWICLVLLWLYFLDFPLFYCSPTVTALVFWFICTLAGWGHFCCKTKSSCLSSWVILWTDSWKGPDYILKWARKHCCITTEFLFQQQTLITHWRTFSFTSYALHTILTVAEYSVFTLWHTDSNSVFLYLLVESSQSKFILFT